MQTKRVIVAVVLAVLGLVWVAQGLGYLGGSTMTGDRTWAVIGAALLVVAAALAWSGRSRHRP
jgi:drug/metabolite transporter (DMT)-like permease